MKPVKFIRAWQTYSVGDVIYPMAAFGQTLVDSGKGEYVEEKKPVTKKTKKKKKAKRK